MILRCWLLAQDIAEKAHCRAADIVFGQRQAKSLPNFFLFACLLACLLVCLFVRPSVCVMVYFYFLEPIGVTPADQLMCHELLDPLQGSSAPRDHVFEIVNPQPTDRPTDQPTGQVVR